MANIMRRGPRNEQMTNEWRPIGSRMRELFGWDPFAEMAPFGGEALTEFTRAFTLPEGIDADHVDADTKNGVLTLTVPKRPETQPRKIALGGGAGRQQQEKSKAKA